MIIAGLAVAVTPLVSATWATATTTAEPSTSLTLRPLHAPRHRALARQALREGDEAAATVRARAAVRLQPGSVDGWLLLATAYERSGDRAAASRATAAALARLHAPASPQLVDHLVSLYPEPAALARHTPSAEQPWRHLAEGLLTPAPRHADAVAASRADRHPDDPEPLRLRVEASLALERPALALHHARLWRQLAPADALAHLAVARALQAAPRPRPRALRDALEQALRDADLHDLRLRGLVEEQLLRSLLREHDPALRPRMRELATALRSRPGDDATQRRRRALCEPIVRGR